MAIPDNAGNTLLFARNIGIPNSNGNVYQDSVGGTDPNDYYRFLLTQTQNFRASLIGLTADADIEILDWQGQRVGGPQGISQNGGTTSESISLNNLGPGIYHIRVYQFSGDTDYTLNVRAENPSTPISFFPPPLIPPDNAGNNLLLARTIGILGPTNQAYRDWVGWADSNDYYRFITTDTTNLRLSLDGLTADTDIELLDWRGSVIRRSNAAGSNPESINVDSLGVGIYHLRVYRYGNANTYYNLNLRAETPIPPDYAGNSLGAARDIGNLGAANQSFRDWLGSPDRDDYYRFSLNRPGNLRLTISGLSADADVEVLDAQGRRVPGGLSQNINNLSETLNLDNLGSGTYYVRVYCYSGDTYYDLNLRAEDAIPQGRWIAEYYNNTALSGNPALTRIENSLNNNWDFNAPANGINSDDFSVRWTGRFYFAGGSYRFNVRADDGIRIWINNNLILDQWILQPATDYQILRDLSPGEYQIRVEYYDHTRHAVAQVGWDRIAPPDYAGNTISNARDIGTLRNIQTYRYSDWVGNADTDDYYHFSIPIGERSNFRLVLDGLSADADLTLLTSGGRIISTSRASGNNPDYFRLNLDGGEYYIRVHQYNGDTNYSLTALRVGLTGDTQGLGMSQFFQNNQSLRSAQQGLEQGSRGQYQTTAIPNTDFLDKKIVDKMGSGCFPGLYCPPDKMLSYSDYLKLKLRVNAQAQTIQSWQNVYNAITNYRQTLEQDQYFGGRNISSKIQTWELATSREIERKLEERQGRVFSWQNVLALTKDRAPRLIGFPGILSLISISWAVSRLLSSEKCSPALV